MCQCGVNPMETTVNNSTYILQLLPLLLLLLDPPLSVSQDLLLVSLLFFQLLPVLLQRLDVK